MQEVACKERMLLLQQYQDICTLRKETSFFQQIDQNSAYEVCEEDLDETLTKSQCRASLNDEVMARGKEDKVNFSGEEVKENKETCSIVEENTHEETEKDTKVADTEGDEEAEDNEKGQKWQILKKRNWKKLKETKKNELKVVYKKNKIVQTMTHMRR